LTISGGATYIVCSVVYVSIQCQGKSFLLTTVYLWFIVNGKKAKACAPTGIAAANVEIEGSCM